MGRRARRARARVSVVITVVVVVLGAAPAGSAPGWSIGPSPNPVGATQTYLDAMRVHRSGNDRQLLRGGQLHRRAGHGEDADRTVERHAVEDRREPEPGRRDLQHARRRDVCEHNELLCGRELAGRRRRRPRSPSSNDGTASRGPSFRARTRRARRAASCTPSRVSDPTDASQSVATSRAARPARRSSSGGPAQAWVIVPSPDRLGSASSTLDGVSCVPNGTNVSCFAVGSWTTTTEGKIFYTLTERWGAGGWAVVPSPNVSSDQRSAARVSVVHEPDVVRCGRVLATHSRREPGGEVGRQDMDDQTGCELHRVDVQPAQLGLVPERDQLRSRSAAGRSAARSRRSSHVGTACRGLRFRARTPPAPHGSTLAGISCVGGGKCWAAGSARTPPTGSSKTLTERNF